MSSNRKLKSHMKSHVGRTFGTRKYNLITVYDTDRSVGNGRTTHRDDIGEVVLVLDETNVRVRVTLASGGTGWIAKHFLHKEIKGSLFNDHDGISSVIDKLSGLYADMTDFNGLDNDGACGKVETWKEVLSKMLSNLRDINDFERRKALNIR
jgi:hypothetical protein